jgi:hypothetical protein
MSPQPRIVVENDDDGDYAPKPIIKRKERTAKARAAKRHSETPMDTGPKIQPPDPKTFDAKKIKAVVEEAKNRAVASGKPDLAAAVNEIYLQSLKNGVLMELLQAILSQSATPEQTTEFQTHVKTAKKRLKEQKEAKKSGRRDLPELSNGTQSLPLRSPSKFTPVELETSSAIPSTEPTDTLKPKGSLRVKSPSKDSGRRRSGHSGTMSASPMKARSGSPAGSDSSLTDMTSNPDEDMADEADGNYPAGLSTGVVAMQGKDHAAERGSLAAPNRNLKRSSADAEFQDEERDRVLAAKKQKLNERITRDGAVEESHVRDPADSRVSRLRARQGKNGTLAPPSLSLNTSGTLQGNGRGSRAVSTDLDSPLSTPLTASSRQSTPHVYKGPAKTFGKKAKTKQS